MNRKEFFIDAPWGRIAVITYHKEDLPLVIFCHGRTDSADTFLPLIELMPTNYHYVTFDLPGNGYSDKLPLGNVLATFAFVPALKMVADLYGDKKFIFIGHSGGAELGLLYNISTGGSRITKFVDIDFLTITPQVTAYETHTNTPDEPMTTFTFKDWLNYHYVRFFDPSHYGKLNGTLETAPSYTKEQVITMLKDIRHLSQRTAEIALRRNIRPDPKNPGKYKLVWDQRLKVPTRPPVGAEYYTKLRKRYPVPMLSLINKETLDILRVSCEPDLVETLHRIYPYYKLVKFDNYHDLQLIIPEQLVPHIVEFMEMDLNKVNAKGQSKI